MEEEKATPKEEIGSSIKEQTKKTLQKIKENAKEEDPKFSSTMTLRTILGGDFLTAQMVRHHIGIIVLIVVFAIVVALVRGAMPKRDRKGCTIVVLFAFVIYYFFNRCVHL